MGVEPLGNKPPPSKRRSPDPACAFYSCFHRFGAFSKRGSDGAGSGEGSKKKFIARHDPYTGDLIFTPKTLSLPLPTSLRHLKLNIE